MQFLKVRCMLVNTGRQEMCEVKYTGFISAAASSWQVEGAVSASAIVP